MTVSTFPPIVKPEACQKRVLLLTSETALEVEVRDALQILQQAEDSALFLKLTYLDPTSLTDFLAVLDLLDHVRQGYFDMIHIVPSASTWSRSRHSGLPGQPPVCSRSSPLGLSSLSPEETEKIHSANRVLEIAAWVAEQTLHCPSKVIGALFSYLLKTSADTFHTVLRRYGYYGSSNSLRAHVTFDVPLANCASSLDRTTSVRLASIPIVFNFENVCLWAGPLLNKFETDLCTGVLFLFVAPAAMNTSFYWALRRRHVSYFCCIGTDFWSSCVYDATLDRSFVSLRAGDQADLTPLGASPLLSPSLASCPSFLRSVYEAWKAGTLTRSMLADVTTSDYLSAFFLRGPLCSLLHAHA